MCLAVLGILVLYPTLRLFAEALADWQGAALRQGSRFASLRNTAVISLASVLTSGLVGTALAWFVHHFRFPGRNVLAAMAYVPFTLPPLVGVLSFWYLISQDGVLPRFLGRAFGITDAYLQGPAAILLIHTYSFYVFFYAMVGAVLKSLDFAQIEAARTLGATPWRTFTRVTLPALKPALLGASLLTFMSSGASFSAPLFFGNNYPMLSVQIYTERSMHRNAVAVTLTVILCLVSLAGLALFRSSPRAPGAASKGVQVPVRNRAARILVAAAAWLCIAALLLPHATIAWLSFVDHRRWATEVVPTALTLANYLDIVRDLRSLIPILNSLWMSTFAAVLTLVVALPASYLIGRKRFGGKWVNLIVMLPWALPGTVIAMNLIVAFNDPWWPLYGTVWILPVAYFVRNVPLLTRIATASVEAFDASLIEAARTLGSSPAFCFWRIVIPLLLPALVAGAAMVFAGSLGEFVASILLYSPQNVPIAVQINMLWRGSGVGAAFAYSVLLMVAVAGTFLLAHRFTERLL